MVVEGFGGCLPAEGLAGQAVEGSGDGLEVVGWYNGTRLHSTVGYLSPAEYEATTSKKAIPKVA